MKTANSNTIEMTTAGLVEGASLICSAFEIIGEARSHQGDSWSKVIIVYDSDNKKHQLLIKNSDLIEPKIVLQRMVDLGLRIHMPLKKQQIVNFISIAESEIRVLIPKSSGWYDDKFYLPNTNELVPAAEEKTISNELSDCFAKNNIKGSLLEWNNRLGRLLTGNSNLILAATTVLAAPLLKHLNVQNYGLNFLGTSSKGKSTICEFAASVIGDTSKNENNYIVNFRTTDNALESICWGHNDLCLVLDEFGQLDPYKVKDTVYLLGNGTVKRRSDKNGDLRAKKSFSLTFLSSSEVSLSDAITSGGQKIKSGMEVRFIDIDSQVSEKFGCFENIQDFNSSKDFVDHIKNETKKLHGSLFFRFIQILSEDLINNKSILDSFNQSINSFCKMLVQKSDSPLINRIYKSIGLNYAVGVYAINKKLLPIDEDDLLASLKKVAEGLRNTVGKTNGEEHSILSSLSDYIFKFQNSKFENDELEVDSVFPPLNSFIKIPLDRAGFIKTIDDTECYLLNGNKLKEICSCSNIKQISKVLNKHNLLKTDNTDTLTKVVYLNKLRSSQRFYVISSSILNHIENNSI